MSNHVAACSATPHPAQPTQVTRTQRDHAKHMAYGLLYGMGPMALAAALGVSPKEAMELSDGFKRTLPGVDAWKKR